MCSDPFAEALDAVIGAMDLTLCTGCDLCGIRCAEGVPMSRDEYRAVSEYAARPHVAVEIERLARQQRAMPLGDGVAARACSFRDTERGGCAVYPVRPLVCRLLGHVEWMPCPVGRVAHHAPTGPALALMRHYAAFERHTYDEWTALTGGTL